MAATQESYVKALDTLPLVTVVLGKFKTKKIKCRHSPCTHSGERIFEPQEKKRTDVNIGIHMLDDAHSDACDNVVLVSGDSDLVAAVLMVKLRYPEKKIWVYVPARDATRGAAVELRTAADEHRQLPLNFIQHAHLPAQVPYGASSFIAKPLGW